MLLKFLKNQVSDSSRIFNLAMCYTTPFPPPIGAPIIAERSLDETTPYNHSGEFLHYQPIRLFLLEPIATQSSGFDLAHT